MNMQKNQQKNDFKNPTVNAHCTFESIFLPTAYFLTISNKLSRNFVFLKHTLYIPCTLRTLYVSNYYNLFPAAYSSRFIQLFRYFEAGKITYTASISSNKWLKVEKNVEKSKTTKI